jgi:hypothetical protein
MRKSRRYCELKPTAIHRYNRPQGHPGFADLRRKKAGFLESENTAAFGRKEDTRRWPGELLLHDPER